MNETGYSIFRNNESQKIYETWYTNEAKNALNNIQHQIFVDYSPLIPALYAFPRVVVQFN